MLKYKIPQIVTLIPEIPHSVQTGPEYIRNSGRYEVQARQGALQRCSHTGRGT